MAAKKRHKDKSAMKAYSQFIADAKAKEAVLLVLNSLPKHDPYYCYGERHHVYPKCLTADDTNGQCLSDNRKANLVFMTFADHVHAHVLLAAVYSQHAGLQVTPRRMLVRKKGRILAQDLAQASKLHSEAIALSNTARSAKGLLYAQTEKGKAEFVARNAKHFASTAGKITRSTAVTKRNLTLGKNGKHNSKTPKFRVWARANLNKLRKEGKLRGYTMTDQHKAAVVTAFKAYWLTEAGRATRSSNTARRNLTLSAQVKHQSQTSESRAKFAELSKRAGAVEHTCPHCGRQGKGNRMLQAHFDNCPSLTSQILAISLATGEVKAFKTVVLAEEALSVNNVSNLLAGDAKLAKTKGWFFKREYFNLETQT